jgi:protein SCO1/2
MKKTHHLMLALTLAAAAMAPHNAIAQGGATSVDLTKGLYFNQKLGTQIPLDLPFKDETGKDVRIGDYFNDKPVILALVFYDCKSSCLLIKEGLLKSLNSQKAIKVGKDVDVVVVSINHKETPELAAAMKKNYVDFYRYDNSGEGWHLLTGTRESVRALTDSVGFGFTMKEIKDPETGEVSDQITHPSGIIILSPQGVTSLYLLGATYPATLVKDGIKTAAANQVGKETETILFGCFTYDPSTGKLRPVVENILKVSGIATMLILFTSIGIMAVRNKRTPIYKGAGEPNSQ